MIYYWIGKATVGVLLMALTFCVWVYIADKGPGVATLLLIFVATFLFGFVAAMFEETGDPWE